MQNLRKPWYAEKSILRNAVILSICGSVYFICGLHRPILATTKKKCFRQQCQWRPWYQRHCAESPWHATGKQKKWASASTFTSSETFQPSSQLFTACTTPAGVRAGTPNCFKITRSADRRWKIAASLLHRIIENNNNNKPRWTMNVQLTQFPCPPVWWQFWIPFFFFWLIYSGCSYKHVNDCAASSQTHSAILKYCSFSVVFHEYNCCMVYYFYSRSKYWQSDRLLPNF